jgi:predicted dehydrogenase
VCLVPCITQEGRNKLIKKLNVGIIGAGYAAHARAKAIDMVGVDKIEIKGIFDSNFNNANEFAGELKTRNFKILEEILSNDEINTIAICVPNKFHYEITLKALENNKNIICEYPLVVESYEFAEQLIDIAEKKELFIHVGQTMNFDSDLNLALKYKNCLGKLYMGYKYMTFGKPGSWFVESGFRRGYEGLGEWYINNSFTGGWLIASCYHGIQILRRIFGEVTNVSAFDTGDGKVGAGSILLSHENGASSVIQWGMALSGKTFNILIVTGSEGSIEVNDGKFDVGSKNLSEKGIASDTDTFYEDTRLLLLKLDGQVDKEYEYSDMLKTLKISFAAQEAALKRSTIKIRF